MAEQLAFIGQHKAFHPAVVMTAHHGHNDALIANVARLYIPDGATVIDATWGHGGFWHRTDTSRFRLVGSDLLEAPGAAVRADFRTLPFSSSCADVITLDPPYVPVTSKMKRTIHATYRNEQAPGLGQLYSDVVAFYRAGMTEAWRVLRPGGTCWVKCQDMVNGKQQHWSVVIMHDLALELGYRAQDMFVLVNPQPPGARHAERQFHARRNHSYLWIFTKRRPHPIDPGPSAPPRLGGRPGTSGQHPCWPQTEGITPCEPSSSPSPPARPWRSAPPPWPPPRPARPPPRSTAGHPA